MRLPLDVLRLYEQHDYTLADAFATRMAVASDRPFILFKGETWSWAEFDRGVRTLARTLADANVRSGDRVAIMAPNHIGHVLLLFALARLGAIMVPLNPDLQLEETRYAISKSEPCVVVTSNETISVISKACEAAEIRPWLLSLDAIAANGIGIFSKQPSDFSAPSEAPSLGKPDDVCIIIYTSGTTGFPKGVMHTQRNFLLAGEGFVSRVRLQETDRVMIVLPLFHLNGFLYSISGMLVAGGSALIVPKFSASTFWRTAAEGGATEVNITDSIGSILLARPRSEFAPEHKIRATYGLWGNGVVPFQTEFGVPEFYTGFGMSEMPGVTCNPPDHLPTVSSMGKLAKHPDPAQPWAECRIVDDNGMDVATNTVGELIVKSPVAMKGYFRDEAATAQAFRDGWFYTGDYVRRDEKGYFYYVSRKKDIIRRRGENIAGAELDRVIAMHPGVAEVAAIAVPSELGEDEIMAVVVPAEGAQLSAQEIARWCGDRLAPHKVPRFVVFARSLPKTPTFKVSKEKLRQDQALRQSATDLSMNSQSK